MKCAGDFCYLVFLDLTKLFYVLSHYSGKNVQHTAIQACNTLGRQLADGLGSVLQ